MWGNLEGASELESDDKLSILLYETSGPKQISVEDGKWKELLKHYDRLVHLDPEGNSVVNVASVAMARNAVSNSNIAALAIHVTRMMDEIISSNRAYEEKEVAGQLASSEKEKYGIMLQGKVRATCGALNILRIYIHATIVSICCTHATASNKKDALEMCFVYAHGSTNSYNHVARDLMQSLVQFISLQTTSTSDSSRRTIASTFYDATVFSLSVLLVMLSTQLYSNTAPQIQQHQHYFLDAFMKEMPQLVAPLIHTTLVWIVQRPRPPVHSIAHHHVHILYTLLASNFTVKPSYDGFYDNSYIVHASAPTTSDHALASNMHLNPGLHHHHPLLDATRGVIKVSSTILLLPFRLLTLAFRYLAPHHHSQSNLIQSSRDKNQILWITNSPIADFGSCLLLLLLNNYRTTTGRTRTNPYREYFELLKDSRWDTNDTTAATTSDPDTSYALPSAINFESLFTAFATSVHSELGALLFYTLLQASPNFSASITIRFDLDQLVIPLLRTIYVCTSFNSPIIATSTSSSSSNQSTSTSPPFRSQSQLYLILILLLIFSQHSSFGSDAFRRIILPEVRWYKERSVKDISLGSLILLVLLRTLIFNLHRLNDSFLFSNSSAILLNLSPCIVHLHSYTSMRLVNVLLSIMKRYSSLSSTSSLYIMYKEATHSLLQVTCQCLRSNVIATNLELVYALLYSQVDLQDYLKDKIQTKESKQLSQIIAHVDSLIRAGLDDDIPMSAVQAMEILLKSSSKVVTFVKSLEEGELSLQHSSSNQKNHNNNNTPLNLINTNTTTNGDFTFIYEEDVHPEVFFVPYIWEVVVNVVTHNFLEWNFEKVSLLEGDSAATTSSSITNVASSGKDESSALLNNVEDIV